MHLNLFSLFFIVHKRSVLIAATIICCYFRCLERLGLGINKELYDNFVLIR